MGVLVNVCDAARAASPCDYASLFSSSSASRRQSTPPPSLPDLADKPNPSFACRQSIPRPTSASPSDYPHRHDARPADKPSLPESAHDLVRLTDPYPTIPGRRLMSRHASPLLTSPALACLADVPCPATSAGRADKPHRPHASQPRGDYPFPSRTRPCRHTSPLLASSSRQPKPKPRRADMPSPSQTSPGRHAYSCRPRSSPADMPSLHTSAPPRLMPTRLPGPVTDLAD